MEFLTVLIVGGIILVMLLAALSSKSNKDSGTMTFDAVFKNRVGQDPTSYVISKLTSGSDLGAIRYLFDIIAAEVEVKSKCKSPGFDFYYAKAIRKQPTQVHEKVKPQIEITKEFAASQLIGKSRFLQSYGDLLISLAENKEFIKFVMALQKELAGREVTDTRAANRRIADYFYINKANERFSEVQEIVKGVVAYGKQASAHISIYYAMFLYQK